jgi:hypothetical protein
MLSYSTNPSYPSSPFLYREPVMFDKDKWDTDTLELISFHQPKPHDDDDEDDPARCRLSSSLVLALILTSSPVLVSKIFC